MSAMLHEQTTKYDIVSLDAVEIEAVDGGILPFLVFAGMAVLATTAEVGFIDGIFSGIAKHG